MSSKEIKEILVRVDRALWPVRALGYGRRAAIWFQGCSIGCRACCSTHTWSAEGGSTQPVEAVLEWLGRVAQQGPVDGVTISGGEPFDQPEALKALLDELRRHFCQPERARDILVYSGYPWKRLQRDFRSTLERIDVVISEPFVEALPVAWLRGSSNQVMHRLTPIAMSRYPEYEPSFEQQLDYHLTGGTLQLIGIPGRDDFERILNRLNELGIELQHGDVSAQVHC